MSDDLHGVSDQGCWLAYAPNGDRRALTGLPETTFGPFPDRAAAEAFVAISRGTPWRTIAVNLTDYPDWFGSGTGGLI